MKSPFTGKEMSIVKEWHTMSFRKEEFRVLFHAYKCDDTGEQFEDEAFAQLNFNQLVNQYRVKYSIPFPEKIIEIREKYEVSATKMSEILGFGTNSYRQYESGEVPNQSNAKLILLADDPHEFKKLVGFCTSLESKVLERVNHRIDALMEEQKRTKIEYQLEKYLLGAHAPNSLTGYRTPSFQKISEMVVYFTEKLQPWKTKMNKLLFYADFSMYQQTGFSISGTQYRAIQMGPVPNNFNSIFEYLANKDEIDINSTSFSNGGIGEQFTPNPKRKFNANLFTEKELSVLATITEKFRATSTSDIIEISHKEKAWLDNQASGNLIDYTYSFELL